MIIIEFIEPIRRIKAFTVSMKTCKPNEINKIRKKPVNKLFSSNISKKTSELVTPFSTNKKQIDIKKMNKLRILAFELSLNKLERNVCQ